MTDEIKNIIIDGVPCYESREACEDRIDELEKEPYYLRPWEASRPILSAQYGIYDGKQVWYVYADYDYRPDSDIFDEDGPFERIE